MQAASHYGPGSASSRPSDPPLALTLPAALSLLASQLRPHISLKKVRRLPLQRPMLYPFQSPISSPHNLPSVFTVPLQASTARLHASLLNEETLLCPSLLCPCLVLCPLIGFFVDSINYFVDEWDKLIVPQLPTPTTPPH